MPAILTRTTFIRAVTLFIAEGGYAGRFPIAPGTAGTLAGAALYWIIRDWSPLEYGALLALVIVSGIWAAGRAEVILGCKDSSSIVIDEIAGYLTAMFLLPPTWTYAAAAFFLFRIFDILKFYPLNRFEKIGGGTGVMLDDLGAGVLTNVLLHLYPLAVHR